MTDKQSTLHEGFSIAALPAGLEGRRDFGSIAFERTRMPMVIADARRCDTAIILANKAFLDLTGYAAEEVLGRNCRFLQGPSTSQAALAELRAGLAEGRDIDVELLNCRKDGTAFWNRLHISPIRDDAGEVAYYFASQFDVTEYRKVQALEASEHRLLMEVDHRTKNVLAIVTSLVRLSNADDAAQYAAAVQQRIQALSHAHGLLSERGWKEVGLRDIVLGQLSRYKAHDIAVDGPAIAVQPLTVQPLAMVIHELAMNAKMHGALSNADGALRITWEETSEIGGFRLVWTEQGVARPDASTPGFGTVMIRAMVESQLAGRVRQEWTDTGLQIVLEIPKRK